MSKSKLLILGIVSAVTAIAGYYSNVPIPVYVTFAVISFASLFYFGDKVYRDINIIFQAQRDKSETPKAQSIPIRSPGVHVLKVPQPLND
jgi:hypothetical protein